MDSERKTGRTDTQGATADRLQADADALEKRQEKIQRHAAMMLRRLKRMHGNRVQDGGRR